MQNAATQHTATSPHPIHRPALRSFAAKRAKAVHPVTASEIEEIEEYVNNLWYMDGDPYLYTTD